MSATLAHLEGVMWSDFDGPAEFDPAEVPRAIRSLATAGSEKESERGYHRVLYSFGNNHAGTMWPAAVAAVPFIVSVARERVGWARRGALEVLIDMYCSFEGQAGYELVVDQSGSQVSVTAAVRAAIASELNLFHEIASSGDIEQVSSSARELVAAIREDDR